MRPHLVEKVWGGRRLADSFGKDLGEGLYGESWEVADLPEGQSRVEQGPHLGRTLGELREAFDEALVGSRAAGKRFPLLVKILDASADLSVQVHPGKADLGRFEGAHSKDESWLILESDSGSILHGFADDVSPEAFRKAIDNGGLENLLRRVSVESGDVFRVAPGCVHAICSGTALLEIQEPSDTTFRVFDYDRPGLDGKPRQLHVEEAIEVARLTPEPELSRGESFELQDGAVEILVDVDSYRIARTSVDGRLRWQTVPTTPQIVFVTRGELHLNGVRLGRWEAAVLPASLGRVEARGNATFISACLGGEELLRAW